MAFLAALASSAYAAATSFLTGLGFSAAVSAGILQVGGSLLLQAAANALFGAKAPKAQDVARELSQPTTQPAYRFVYGETRATGTPAGTPIQGDYIWGCWILNSRASELLTPTVYLDKRLVVATGDPFDFSLSGGADASESPFDGYVKYWISRGDEVSPPALFLQDAIATGPRPDLWTAADGWQGNTVIWMRLAIGPNSSRAERWPSAPPLVEVEGRWSKVWDLRDPAQSLDDPTTWQWSQNAALCTLDAATQHPVRPYRAANLHLSSWSDGADVSDETTETKSGTETRYILAGTLVFDSGEIEDHINPMFISAGADPIRIGGLLGYAAAAWREPETTLTYFLGEGFEDIDMMPGDQLMNQLRVSYLSPERGYETASLQPWDIPGALAADGGVPAVRDLDLSFCPSPTQAMRIRKITGLRLRRQERVIGGELPPEAFDLVGGSTTNLALPAPFDGLDGQYEIEAIHPAFDIDGQSGVHMRLPASLVKTGDYVYAYEPATDEETIVSEPYESARSGVQLPGAITVTTGPGVDLNTGGTVIPRLRIAFDPSPSGGVSVYNWQTQAADEGWQDGPNIEGDLRDGSGKVFALLATYDPSKLYDIRVRTVSVAGQSDWLTISDVSSSFVLTNVTVTGGVNEVAYTATTPLTNFKSIRLYRAAVGVAFGSATLIDTTDHASGAAVAATIAQTPGTYDYWLAPLSPTDLEGAAVGPFTRTVT